MNNQGFKDFRAIMYKTFHNLAKENGWQVTFDRDGFENIRDSHKFDPNREWFRFTVSHATEFDPYTQHSRRTGTAVVDIYWPTEDARTGTGRISQSSIDRHIDTIYGEFSKPIKTPMLIKDEWRGKTIRDINITSITPIETDPLTGPGQALFNHINVSIFFSYTVKTG